MSSREPADADKTKASDARTLYIIYNARSTIYGKLQYVYRKATCPDPSSNPACAACELTHGPSLRLNESPQWIETKRRIHHVKVVQVHQDEMPPLLRDWMKTGNVRAPAVVVEGGIDGKEGWGSSSFKVLLTAEDLARVRTNHEEFLALLGQRANEQSVNGISIDAGKM